MGPLGWIAPHMSIALACNVYQDAAALRGLLELGSRYFDNIFIIHSGPGGARSTDGTIELCEQFGIAPVFDDIQRGFGRIRTRLIHECGCEWAFILDADERFFPELPTMTCEGTEKEWLSVPNLKVEHLPDIIAQGAHIKHQIQRPDLMAIRTTRRHWHDFSMKHPSQNWFIERDHQLRIVRNVPEIAYVADRVMHERLLDSRTGKDPVFLMQDDMGGPFHDHFHLHFRKSNPGHKEFNESNYQRLERGESMVTR
jgi:hypothetical protein